MSGLLILYFLCGAVIGMLASISIEYKKLRRRLGDPFHFDDEEKPVRKWAE